MSIFVNISSPILKISHHLPSYNLPSYTSKNPVKEKTWDSDVDPEDLSNPYQLRQSMDKIRKRVKRLNQKHTLYTRKFEELARHKGKAQHNITFWEMKMNYLYRRDKSAVSMYEAIVDPARLKMWTNHLNVLIKDVRYNFYTKFGHYGERDHKFVTIVIQNARKKTITRKNWKQVLLLTEETRPELFLDTDESRNLLCKTVMNTFAQFAAIQEARATIGIVGNNVE